MEVFVPVPGSPPDRVVLVVAPDGGRWNISVRLQFARAQVEFSGGPLQVPPEDDDFEDLWAEACLEAAAPPLVDELYTKKVLAAHGVGLAGGQDIAVIADGASPRRFDHFCTVRLRGNEAFVDRGGSRPPYPLPLSASEAAELPRIFGKLAEMSNGGGLRS